VNARALCAVLIAASGCAPRPARAPFVDHTARRIAQRPWTPSPSPALTMDCGELALYRAELVAEGKGERHPDVIATDARLGACTDKRPSAEACQAAQRRLEELRATRGERHPDVIVARAKIELCRKTYGDAGWFAPGPPDAAECAALRARRQQLVAEGKGERHPAMLAVDARLRDCP
jgi:hypothetical protein